MAGTVFVAVVIGVVIYLAIRYRKKSTDGGTGQDGSSRGGSTPKRQY